MSRELTGSNREVVGSPAYFEKLHNAHFDGTLRRSRGDDFARSMESLAGNRFCHLFKPNLERLVQALERDLEQGLRDNDYIRDENADNLRAAIKQLERCGARCYSLERKVDGLAWFVGGDPEEIRELQKLINATGMTNRLKEDGVYGEKTQEAEKYLGDIIKERLDEFLLNPAAVEYATKRISKQLGSASINMKKNSFISPLEVGTALAKILFDNRKAILRFIWRAGAEHFLRSRGYDVAALLLEHSLERNPHNMYFSQHHWATRKLMQTKGFKLAYYELEKNILQDPAKYSVPGKIEIDFEETGDIDFFYAIGKGTIKYTCKREGSTVLLKFEMRDEYDFDEIRTIYGSADQSVIFDRNFGKLANDAGFLSFADQVITEYVSFFAFEKTINLGDKKS